MRFQIVAIVILIIFYGCYFGKMLIQKRQGIQTDQIGKGKVGFVKFIELTLKFTTIVVPIVEIISIYMNVSFFPTLIRNVGVAIALLGDIIFIISVFTMKDSWRAGVSENERTELITNGIYKISRNPAFLGFDLVYIGILMMFFNIILFIVSVIAIIMFHLQIVNVEEDFLLSSFGKEYLEYKNKVNRYIGRKR